MRNLRKLSAVVIAIALVLTSMTAAFAATTAANADKAATLKDLGLYAGTDANDVAAGLDGALTTQDSLIFLAKLFGYSDAAGKLTADEVAKALAKFDDASSISDYAKNVVAYSAANGILSGSTKGTKFFVGAKDTVTAARFATFMLKQMGYTVPTFTQSVAQIAEVKGSKVSATITGDLTRDVAVGMMYGALTAEKAAGKTVIDGIVGTDAAKLATAKKAGLIVAASTGELDVEKVEAINLRELVITFTKAVVADEAKKPGNYSIKTKADAATATPEKAELSEDGKTVTLRTTAATSLSNYSSDIQLTINKAVGLSAEKEIKGISVKDTTVPSVVSVKVNGPRDIKVTLSEPLNDEDTTNFPNNLSASFKLDEGKIGFDSISTSGRDVNITTYSDLSEGSHKIEVVSAAKVTDDAGYTLQASSNTFDYVKDTSALSAVVSEATEKSVTLKFNKAVKKGSFKGNGNVKLSHTYSGSNEVLASTEGVVTTDDNTSFKVNFVNPFPPGTATVYLKYDKDSGDLIQDNYGNKLSATTFTVTTSADTTKPTATAEFKTAKSVRVTFSEDVQNVNVSAGKDKADNASDNTNNYVLKCGNDVIQVVGFEYPTTGSYKVIDLITNEDALNGSNYTLTVKNIKDRSVAANQIDEVTLTFTGTDKVAPDFKTGVLASNSKVRITYSEAMDVASVTDKTAYKIAKFDSSTNKYLALASLGEKDTVEIADANKAVVITFKDALVKGTKYQISIGRVKDVAGNWTKFNEKTFEVTGEAVSSVALKEYQLTSRTNIKLKIEDTVQNVQASDFEYSIAGGAPGSYKIVKSLKDVNVVDGNTYITFVIDELPYNTTGGGIEVRTNATTVLTDSTYKVSSKNAFGSLLAFNTLTDLNDKGLRACSIVDKCPAKILNAGTASSDGVVTVPVNTTQKANKSGDTLKTITLTYSEDIYASSVQDSDFTVSGYEVSGVLVKGNKIEITVKNIDYGSVVAGTDIKVKQVGDIEDSARNVLSSTDEITFDAVVTPAT